MDEFRHAPIVALIHGSGQNSVYAPNSIVVKLMM